MKTTKSKITHLFQVALDRVRGLLPHLNRTHMLVTGITLLVVAMALGGLDKPAPEDETPLQLESLALELPPGPIEQLEETTRAAETLPIPPPPEAEWEAVTVRSGQTLDGIFREQGFSVALLHRILDLNGDTSSLTKIRPGDTFEFQRHEDDSFALMRYPIDEASYLLVSYEGDTLLAERETREIYNEVHESEGVIESSLFLAGKRAGLGDGMIMKLANIFGWDIDFVLDIRAGDRFFVVYEKVYREGEYLRDGEILAATFVNQGERFQAFRYEVDGSGRYFAADGRPMRKAFLRAPLNFSYISSSFNPRRLHPVLKRVRAHNGIDYAAPRGTPVYAAGEGKVIRSAYNAANGHHVFIQHANSIVTKYLHFTKRAVKQGQRVKQGKVIGYVGATGLASGPHLHYEFVVNGVHRNPRTVPLPQVEPLEDTALEQFLAHAAPFQNQLSRLESASLYAATE